MWRFNYDLGKAPEKPSTYSLNHGMYTCSSCVPRIEVKADGTDQPVTGQAVDTMSVRAVDSKTVIRIGKKNGTVFYEITQTVSDDGKTLTSTTAYPANSDPKSAFHITFTRLAPAPAGAHAISGSWRFAGGNTSGNAGVITVKSTADRLSYSDFSGASYTAKLDGKDYPVTGGGLWTSVSLKRIDDRTIEETDKRGEKVSSLSRCTISPDGTKMTVADSNKLTGDHSTAVYEKQ